MSSDSTAPVSLILALHSRYEATWKEFYVIELAQTAAHNEGDEAEGRKLRAANIASSRESDALRMAILHQVPRTWVEAMVLHFHAITVLDMLANNEDVPQHDWDTLQAALDTVFDFMCCEVEQDHGEVGTEFQREANRTHFARRFRTGVVEA